MVASPNVFSGKAKHNYDGIHFLIALAQYVFWNGQPRLLGRP